MRIEEEIKQTKFRSSQQKAALNLLYTSNWLGNTQNEFFKSFDLTSSQYNILLDRLLKKKLVTKKRCPADKRATDIMITPSGMALLHQIDSDIDKTEKTHIRLSKEEALQLSDLLDKCRG